MGKKNKSQNKGKSSKKNKSRKSSAVLVLSVKTGSGWKKLFKQKLTNKKPLKENQVDLYFDATDAVRNQIKEGVGKFKKGLKIKMELVEESKSSKKKSNKKKGKKKKTSKSKSSSAKKAVSNTKSKNKTSSTVKSATKSTTKKKTVSRVKKKPTAKKGRPTGRALKKATTGARRVAKKGTKRKSTETKKTAAKKATVAKRGAKPSAKRGVTDDLKKVLGIGPKMEKILHSNGIKTYAALSGIAVKKLQDIMDGAGRFYRSYNASMWKSEATLAKAGKFDKMKSRRK